MDKSAGNYNTARALYLHCPARPSELGHNRVVLELWLVVGSLWSEGLLNCWPARLLYYSDRRKLYAE
eukprot:scaffold25928_cov78-Skeletonema_dohrnii-CCMP3373.AAC.1